MAEGAPLEARAVPLVPPPPALGPAEVGARCLVTGGAGYVGAALTRRLLDAGCEVRTLDLRPASPDPRAEHRVGDLRDHDGVRAAFEGVDTVFHTAAVISTLDAELAPAATRRLSYGVNVRGTDSALRAARAAGVTAFVHTSSFNVVMGCPIDEGDESLPYAADARDLYTRTKIAAERLALAADDPAGMRVCALRPGGLWGGGHGSIMLEAFVAELAKGAFQATIGDGRALLDNTHVDNLVDAELLAARALRARPEVSGAKAYFITDDERINGMEWFRPVVEGLGHRFPSMRVPGGAMRVVASLLERAHALGAPEPTITVRGVRNLTESTSFRLDRARRELEYAPRYRRVHLAELLPDLRRLHDEAARGTT